MHAGHTQYSLLAMNRISVYVVDQKSEVKDFLHSNIYSAMIIGYEKVIDN